MSLPSSSVENLPPRVIKKVTQEVLDLAERPPEGLKMYINEEDLTDIQAAIEGPAGTPYEGGMFRMKLVLGRDFPAAPPQGFFLTKIFHPNVAKNGAICVNTLKRDWKPEHGLKHILLTIKCLLIYPNPESALNEEAGKLLLEHYEDYFSRAQMMTDIHARQPRQALLSTKNAGSTSGGCSAGAGTCGSGSSNSVIVGRKRQVEREGGAIDKKKKDKKKALKRL